MKNKIMMNINYLHVCNAERSRGMSASVNSNTSDVVISERYYVVHSSLYVAEQSVLSLRISFTTPFMNNYLSISFAAHRAVTL